MTVVDVVLNAHGILIPVNDNWDRCRSSKIEDFFVNAHVPEC